MEGIVKQFFVVSGQSMSSIVEPIEWFQIASLAFLFNKSPVLQGKSPFLLSGFRFLPVCFYTKEAEQMHEKSLFI